MSKLPDPKGIGAADRNYFRYFKLLNTEARLVLYKVFQIGCAKDPNTNIKEFLTKERGMTNKRFKSKFDSTMLNQILEDPSGETYDISLLYKCIQSACDTLATEGHADWTTEDEDNLEYLLTLIKNERNDFIHKTITIDEQELHKKVKRLRELLTKTLKKAGERYNKDPVVINRHIAEINNQIDTVLRAPMQSQDATQYAQEIEELRKRQSNFREEGRNELQEINNKSTTVEPAMHSHPSQTNFEDLKLDLVFTEFEMVHDLGNGSHNPIYYTELLNVASKQNEKPSVLIVEGEIGCGKSTLLRVIQIDWAIRSNKIVNVTDYDFVIKADCRNKSISTFTDLLLVTFPKSSYLLTHSELESTVLTNKVLLLLDGIDELNENSKKLLREIFEKQIPQSCGNLHLLCTTRPEKLNELFALLPNGMSFAHTRIEGIAKAKQQEFVRRLHSAMIKKQNIDQSVKALIDYVEGSQLNLGEHYRSPLNLVLLVQLYVRSPELVTSVNSATRLFTEFLRMNRCRLFGRLKKQNECLTEEEFYSFLDNKFLRVMYEECHKTLSSSEVMLSHDSTARLVETCKELNLQATDVCSAFLSRTRTWELTGYTFSLAAAHNSFLEFFAANDILEKLITGLFLWEENEENQGVGDSEHDDDSNEVEVDSDTTTVSFMMTEPNELESGNGPHEVTIMKILESIDSKKDGASIIQSVYCQRLLLNLAGLLILKNDQPLLQKHFPELVKLLGFTSMRSKKWMNLVVEAEYDDFIASLVANEIGKEEIVVVNSQMRVATSIMPHLTGNKAFRVDIEGDPNTVDYLLDVLELLAEKDRPVMLYIHEHWKSPKTNFLDQYSNNPTDGFSDNFVQKLNNNMCQLVSFQGNLYDPECLPYTVENLSLALVNDIQAREYENYLATLHITLPKIKSFRLHILAGVDPCLLPSLPSLDFRLYLSGVTDNQVTWACQVERALLPLGDALNSVSHYGCMCFPRSMLTRRGFEKMVNILAETKIILDWQGIRVCSSELSGRDVRQLDVYTRRKLGCPFCRADEESVWRDL